MCFIAFSLRKLLTRDHLSDIQGVQLPIPTMVNRYFSAALCVGKLK